MKKIKPCILTLLAKQFDGDIKFNKKLLIYHSYVKIENNEFYITETGKKLIDLLEKKLDESKKI